MSTASKEIAEFRDQDGFQKLVAAHRAELLAHCYRFTAARHDAEDLVQETFLRAWRGIKGFEGRSSLRSWLYRIATNDHKTGTRKEWLAARLDLLKAEKELMRRRDELARRREELPGVAIEKVG